MDLAILLAHAPKPDLGPDEVGSGKRWVLHCWICFNRSIRGEDLHPAQTAAQLQALQEPATPRPSFSHTRLSLAQGTLQLSSLKLQKQSPNILVVVSTESPSQGLQHVKHAEPRLIRGLRAAVLRERRQPEELSGLKSKTACDIKGDNTLAEALAQDAALLKGTRSAVFYLSPYVNALAKAIGGSF